ncbi:MAG: hypothetical protein WAM07_06475 [Halobacillus sp.]|uniref:hypothetical protein n=1 Tax=Halobacillus sp. TaxID=56800 RepID=UPI003BB20BA7
MNSIMIGFASISGNTEEIADVLKAHLKNYGFDVTLDEIDEIDLMSLRIIQEYYLVPTLGTTGISPMR